MEKVTQFLEKHVEWLVLGLAVLFAGYMAYSYLLASPVSVQIAGQNLAPGEINEQIVRGPVQRIQTDLEKPAPEIKVDDFVATFRRNMAFAAPQYANLAKPLRFEIFPGAGKVSDAIGVEDVQPGEIVAVAELPAPTKVEVVSGITVVKTPDPNAKPGVPAPAPAPVAAGVQPVVATTDVDWVTVGGSIDPVALQTNWFKAYPKNVNDATAPQLTQTRFLRVELERQEQLPNGTWGPATPVPALKIYKLDPLPPANGTEAERLQYLDWASKNEMILATPAFYEWANKGEPWRPPGSVLPAAAGGAMPLTTPGVGVPLVPFDPANPPKGRPLTPEERKQVQDYKKMIQDQKRMEREQRNPPRVPKGGGVRGPRPATGHDGAVASAAISFRDGGRAPVILAQAQPIPRGGTGGYVAPPGSYTPRYDDSGPQPGFQAQPGFPQPVFQPNLAGGGFDVATLQQPVQFWAHDETVVPGKTYRYRIRYSLLNPVHQVPSVVKDPKLADVLYMSSPWAEWTEPVTIGERVKFWLAGNPNSKEAKFEVFAWLDGTWKQREEKAAPGDVIAGTQWVVVDLRANSRGGGYHVVLVNAQNGTTERREPRRDLEDPARLELEEKAAGGTTPAASAR